MHRLKAEVGLVVHYRISNVTSDHVISVIEQDKRDALVLLYELLVPTMIRRSGYSAAD